MFNNWAQRVTSKPWAIVATALHHLKAATGYRLFVGPAHRAWEKATR